MTGQLFVVHFPTADLAATDVHKFLLIPQGSRILKRYNSYVGYVRSRVQVVWSPSILPDMSSLTIDNLVGADPTGYAGLEGRRELILAAHRRWRGIADAAGRGR